MTRVATHRHHLAISNHRHISHRQLALSTRSHGGGGANTEWDTMSTKSGGLCFGGSTSDISSGSSCSVGKPEPTSIETSKLKNAILGACDGRRRTHQG